MQYKERLTGFVLHRRAYRETSLLIDFFSMEYGRINAVAKGVRGNAKSDKKSLLQPFQLLDFELSGRSNLKNLTRVEAVSQAIPIKHHSLYCGLYINEILVRALPESEPVDTLFEHYQLALLKLANLDTNNVSEFEPLLRQFEFVLLQEMGYLPDFTCDAQTGEPIEGGKYYTFDPQLGFYETHDNMKSAIKGLYLTIIADNSEFLMTEHKLNTLKVAKQICRLALIQIIGSKPIKAREFFI